MARKRKVWDDRLMVIKNMPPLRHTIPEIEFDIQKSEVVHWLVSQPGILQHLFNEVSMQSVEPLLHYDPMLGIWKGVDFHD